jgi:hypothetical protein
MSDNRIRIIEHGIVLLDFSNVKEPDAELHRSAEAKAIIASQPRGQARVLTDVTGSNFNQRSIESLKDLVQHNRPYVKASALVGLSALTRVIFRAVLTLTGRDIRVFETRKEAIAYLLSKRLEPAPPTSA